MDDSLPWLRSEMELLRIAHAREVPIIGFCLGCQILARALGGEVGRLEAGIELGWHEVKLTHGGVNDPVHGGIGWTTTMFHWHRDQVIKLPQGANSLSKSARTPCQAWSLGLRTYGFQYHPEVSAQDITRWIEESPDDLVEAGISADDLIEQTRANYAAFHRITTRLFEQIALLIVPIDRRFAGLPKDIHH